VKEKSRRASYDPAHRKFHPSPLSPLPILGYPRFIGHVSNDSPYFQATTNLEDEKILFTWFVIFFSGFLFLGSFVRGDIDIRTRYHGRITG
jgi:hypothetical protein